MTDDVPITLDTALTTMHADGSRRWLYPRVSQGPFLRARRIVAYVLIGVFTLTPYIRIGGRPFILLNIPQREFTLFGFTFLPTDTLLLALFLLTVVIGICLATALAGRVWCGWACPQTVFMEFVFRPLERLFDGPPGSHQMPGNKSTPLRKVLKYAFYLVISLVLAHTFLAYFVGVDALSQWVRRSPWQHPASFLLILAATTLVMFDFCFFREQACLVACPYGRFQSVMLDRDSLIVSYDRHRGDCIDCGMCTGTCPTGIDIRNGLQLECIACTQCIDACDQVMDRIGKPRGLVRFSSQARIEGETSRALRPRVIIYPLILLMLLGGFASVFAGRQTADVKLLRSLGQPFFELAPGEITNQIRVKITNRGERDTAYSIELVDNAQATLSGFSNPIHVAAGQSRTESILVTLPHQSFDAGKYNLMLRVADEAGFSEDLSYRLLGPFGEVAR